jgi:hypothetical protein
VLWALTSCRKETTDGRGVKTTYSVQDSIIDPFQTVFHGKYQISVQRYFGNTALIEISNYANIKQTNGIPLTVEGQVLGNAITISSQVVKGPTNATVDYIRVNASTGYFSQDSIYLHLSYSDRFDPYYGDLWGVMQ